MIFQRTFTHEESNTLIVTDKLSHGDNEKRRADSRLYTDVLNSDSLYQNLSLRLPTRYKNIHTTIIVWGLEGEGRGCRK